MRSVNFNYSLIAVSNLIPHCDRAGRVPLGVGQGKTNSKGRSKPKRELGTMKPAAIAPLLPHDFHQPQNRLRLQENLWF
jgi:hypothetical protein